MAAFKRLRPATLLKRRLAQVFSCEFCQISKNTFFTEHLWATASILREGRRLKQIEISIISKLTKKIIKKRKMFLHFLFFTCCAHPFSFWASLFTKRPYVSLYSDFHYVQIMNLENILEFIRQKLKKHAHFNISSQDEISSRQKRVNSKRHFTIDKDDFILGWNFMCKHPLKYHIFYPLSLERGRT